MHATQHNTTTSTDCDDTHPIGQKKKMLTNHSPQAHSKHTLHDDRNPCTSFRSEQHTRFCTPPRSHFHLFNHTISTAAFPKATPKVRGHCKLPYMRWYTTDTIINLLPGAQQFCFPSLCHWNVFPWSIWCNSAMPTLILLRVGTEYGVRCGNCAIKLPWFYLFFLLLFLPFSAKPTRLINLVCAPTLGFLCITSTGGMLSQTSSWHLQGGRRGRWDESRRQLGPKAARSWHWTHPPIPIVLHQHLLVSMDASQTIALAQVWHTHPPSFGSGKCRHWIWFALWQMCYQVSLALPIFSSLASASSTRPHKFNLRARSDSLGSNCKAYWRWRRNVTHKEVQTYTHATTDRRRSWREDQHKCVSSLGKKPIARWMRICVKPRAKDEGSGRPPECLCFDGPMDVGPPTPPAEIDRAGGAFEMERLTMLGAYKTFSQLAVSMMRPGRSRLVARDYGFQGGGRSHAYSPASSAHLPQMLPCLYF